jgi:mRNA interferase HigB
VRVISKAKLRDFWAKHPDSLAPLNAWYRNVENADWGKPQDVRDTYRSADPIGDEFVVFDICNNDYRLVVCIDYERSVVYVWDVLTHAQYDRIDFQDLADKKRRERRERRGS